MDEKDRKILVEFTGRRSRSKLSPHSDLICKLRQRGCPYSEITRILADQHDLTVAISTVSEFVVRLEKQRSKPWKAKSRKEKPKAETTPVPVVAKPAVGSMPSSDEIRQRIEALKQQQPPPKQEGKIFEFDSTQPLTLVREDEKG